MPRFYTGGRLVMASVSDPTPQKPQLSLQSLLLVAVLGFLLYDKFVDKKPDSADHAINGVALGKTYASTLAHTYADAWEKAASTIESGKSIGEAQKVLQNEWKASRTAAFTRDVVPGFNLVLPEGAEPTDSAKRTQVAGLWRDFAKGLRGGK